MSSEKVEYIPPYYLITANNTEFKTYTKSGIEVSTQILDRFKVDYVVEYIKE